MANISSGFGKMWFVKADGTNWTTEQKEMFHTIWNTNFGDDSDYWMVLNDMNFESDNEATVDLSGRWAALNNFDSIDRWSDGDFKIFAEMMEKYEMYIEVEFVDEECGCEVLYESAGVIKPYWDSEKTRWSLRYESSFEEGYDYTRENLEKLGFEYWNYTFYDFKNEIEKLVEQQQLPKSVLEYIDNFYSKESAIWYEVEDIVDAFKEEMEVVEHV